MIKYSHPNNWIKYSYGDIAEALVEAKASVLTLKSMPYERGWVENLQQMELKREVAGTSKIEGAEFTERELDEALSETAEELLTRSQKQAHAAMRTYKWIADLQDDRPIDQNLICEIHRRIVTGADDDHCEPGRLRNEDENVTFGQPRHRGVDGGKDCETAVSELANAIRTEYPNHDPLIQALAVHYHFAAMHPFLDGNGRSARALEALLLQRAGLRDFCFIAMSNYYYDEKISYLTALAEVRTHNHDLTSFIRFGLHGIAIQSKRVLKGIQHEMSKALYRNRMYDLFKRLKTPRKRVIAKRQLAILELLLKEEELTIKEIVDRVFKYYMNLKNPKNALLRDIQSLDNLNTFTVHRDKTGQLFLKVDLEWPAKITESEFFDRIKNMPKAKSRDFL